MTDDNNAASGPGVQPDGPSDPAGRGEAVEPGHGGRHGPRGRRHPAPFRFAQSGFIEYDRVLFFSDAVFAIAITLLAIDLKVPHNGELNPATTRGLVGFGISFAVIGLFWLGHHAIFRYITVFNRPLISLNLLFLGTIALLPYPTAVVSVASNPPAEAIVFYAACAAAAGLGECVIWLYATRPGSGLATPAAAAIRLRYALRIGRVPVVFLASIPVALVAPRDAPYIWILVFILGLVINRFVPEPDEPEPIGEHIPG